MSSGRMRSNAQLLSLWVLLVRCARQGLSAGALPSKQGAPDSDPRLHTGDKGRAAKISLGGPSLPSELAGESHCSSQKIAWNSLEDSPMTGPSGRLKAEEASVLLVWLSLQLVALIEAPLNDQQSGGG